MIAVCTCFTLYRIPFFFIEGRSVTVCSLGGASNRKVYAFLFKGARGYKRPPFERVRQTLASVLRHPTSMCVGPHKSVRKWGILWNFKTLTIFISFWSFSPKFFDFVNFIHLASLVFGLVVKLWSFMKQLRTFFYQLFLPYSVLFSFGRKYRNFYCWI